MIRFTCPWREAALKVSDGRAGGAVTCPKYHRAGGASPRARSAAPPTADLDEAPRRRVPAWAWVAAAAAVAAGLVLVAGGLVAARVNRDTAGGADVQKPQGREKVVSAAIDGARQEDVLAPDRRGLLDRSFLSCEGDQVRTIFPNESDRAAVVLPPGKSPKQITPNLGGPARRRRRGRRDLRGRRGPVDAVPGAAGETRAADVF